MTDIDLNGEFTVKDFASINRWDYENAYYWFSDPTRINKLLAQYELYQTITNLPGDILEFGVYKLVSLIRFATYRNLLENDYSRRIIGFDVFGKFPTQELSLLSDKDFVAKFETQGGDGISIEDSTTILARKGFKNISLIAGNVFDTLPNFLVHNPALRISLLHLDLDVKEPTQYVLNELYSRIVPDGLIILDDYGTVQGETDVVDQFVAKHKLKIQKSSYYLSPSYIRKPC